MTKVCDLCGWEYKEEEGYPEGGIAPGTKWEDIKGAEGAELKVTVTEDNYMNYWRALVVVTAIKAE